MRRGGAAPALGRRLAALAALVALGLAGYWSLRLAWGDSLFQQDTLAAVGKAARVLPGNAEYIGRLHSLDPNGNPAALREALRLNPRFSAGWIEMGLRAEIDGDFHAAETFLLEAAKVDRTYDPRWTLANFYLRRGNWDLFWPWVRAAVETAYQDRSPLYRLCWQATDDPKRILALAIPDQPRILAEYLSFLMGTGRLDAAAAVALRLGAFNDAQISPVLLTYCDRLLEAGRGHEAAGVWNQLSRAGLIPHPPLTPERGISLINGTFTQPISGKGFDWRLATVSDVSVNRAVSPAALKFVFSGRQPEQCRLVEQILCVEPSKSYRLRFRYRTEGIGPATGLRWIVSADAQKVLSAGPDLSSEDWKEDNLKFSVPAGLDLARLSLDYARSVGTTRIEGSVYLSGLALEFLH